MRRLCLVIALLLVASLVSSTAGARGIGVSVRARDASEERTPLDFKALLGRLSDALVSIVEKTGCAIDPLGRCAPDPTVDTGPNIDPWGQSTPTATSDTGPNIDPLGGGSH